MPEWLVIEPSGIVDEEVLATEDKPNVATMFDEADLDRDFVVRVRFSNLSQDLKTTVRKRENIASIREKCKTLADVSSQHPKSIVTSFQDHQDVR